MIGGAWGRPDPVRATTTRAWAKEAVFPEERFANASDRGPGTHSTGEVMASGKSVSEAYARVLCASGRGRRGGSTGLPLQAGGEHFELASRGDAGELLGGAWRMVSRLEQALLLDDPACHVGEP